MPYTYEYPRPALTVDRVGGVSEGGSDMIADLRRHIADERLEHRFLGIEIGIESTERDAGALGDRDDRAVRKSALTKLVAGGIEDLAQRPLAARCARRLAVACRADLLLLIHGFPHPVAIAF